MVLDAYMLLQPRPNLENIKQFLAKGVKHKSDGAKYFEIMLKVMGNGGFPEDEVFPAFQDLFIQRQLANYKNIIMNPDDPQFAREDICLRTIPPGLKHKFICSSNRACEGSQRICNTSSPLRSADEDELMSLMLSRHYIAWFFEHFLLLDLDFLL